MNEVLTWQQLIDDADASVANVATADSTYAGCSYTGTQEAAARYAADVLKMGWSNSRDHVKSGGASMKGGQKVASKIAHLIEPGNKSNNVQVYRSGAVAFSQVPPINPETYGLIFSKGTNYFG